jgi:hypothetical protein
MGPSSPRFFYDISSGFFDRLEAVSIMVDYIPADMAVAVLEAASELREFAFTPEHPRIFDRVMFPLPWAQLTALHFGKKLLFRPTEAHVMLRQCTSLVSCKISLLSHSKSLRQASPTIIPNLRKLQLTLRAPSHPCLQDFFFPGLITLELNQLDGALINGLSLWQNEFCPFISRHHKLQGLEVHWDLPPSIAQNMLQNIPMLNSLALLAPTKLADSILAMIANGSLVPRLDCLTCNVDRLSQALDMLESRLKDTRMTTIQDVTIFHENPGMERDTKRVEMLRRSGLSITVTSAPVRVNSSSSGSE